MIGDGQIPVLLGIAAADPLVLGSMATTMLLVVTAATILPAHRASRERIQMLFCAPRRAQPDDAPIEPRPSRQGLCRSPGAR